MPWFVAYGWVIAWVIVVGLAVLPLGVVRVVRHLRDRRRARDEHFSFEVGLTAPVEGPVTLRGVLRDGTVTTIVRSTGEHHERSDRLAVDLEGEHVELAGPIRVVRGSRVRASWRARRNEVRAGDTVIVRGTAKRAASSYREQGWIVEADGPAKPLELCANKPRARGKPLHPAWVIGLLVGFGFASWGGLRWFGRHELARYPRPQDADRAPLRWTEPAVIAAIMPGSHERALAHLYLIYEGLIERSQANLDARVEIVERLRGRLREHLDLGYAGEDRSISACEAGSRELASQARFEEVLDRACGSEALALLSLGEFRDAAARATPPIDVVAETALGRWSKVATLSSDPCNSALARALGGAAYANPTVSDPRQVVQCQIAGALARTGEDRAAALQLLEVPLLDSFTRDRIQSLVQDLRWAFDPTYVEHDELQESDFLRFARGSRSSMSVGILRERSALRRTWLARFAPETARGVHAFRLHAAIVRGDFATAHEELEHLPPDFAALVALREGRPREQRSIDGAELARQIRTTTLDWSEIRTRIMLEAPHVASDRDDVIRAVRAAIGDSRTYAEGRLEYLHDAAIVRDALRAAGDLEGVARWQKIIDRHVAPLDDSKQVAFAVFVTP